MHYNPLYIYAILTLVSLLSHEKLAYAPPCQFWHLWAICALVFADANTTNWSDVMIWREYLCCKATLFSKQSVKRLLRKQLTGKIHDCHTIYCEDALAFGGRRIRVIIR